MSEILKSSYWIGSDDELVEAFEMDEDRNDDGYSEKKSRKGSKLGLNG